MNSLSEANTTLKNYGQESFHGDRIWSLIKSPPFQSRTSMSAQCSVNLSLILLYISRRYISLKLMSTLSVLLFQVQLILKRSTPCRNCWACSATGQVQEAISRCKHRKKLILNSVTFCQTHVDVSEKPLSLSCALLMCIPRVRVVKYLTSTMSTRSSRARFGNQDFLQV